MRKNWLKVLCTGLVFVFPAVLVHAQGAEGEKAKQVTCTGKVVDEQGRPIAGVKVTLIEMVYDEATYTYDPNLIGEVQTGLDGAFSFNETVKDNQYRYSYIVAEKEELALGFDNWNMRDGNKELQIKLGQSKELAGIVVDDKDAPVLDARVEMSMLVLGEGRERKSLYSLVAPELLTTNTDATGKFAFARIPAGATAEFIVEKSGRATLSTYKRTGESYQKLNFTEGQKDIRLVLPVEAKIEGLVVEKNTGKPVGGVKIRYETGQEAGYYRPKPLTSKEDGTFSIDALTANQYMLALAQPNQELPDWVADPVEVITEADKTKSDIKIELSKGGVLDVKITDAVSKEPVEDARVGVNSQTSNQSAYSRTNEDGLAQMRLMPGDYQVTYLYKQGYSQQRLQDTVTIVDGTTQHLEYELVGMPKITGIVCDQENKPIEGVEMEICPRGGREDSVSNAEGKFEVTYDLGGWPSGRTPTIFLIGRQYERNLAAAIQVDEDTRELEMKLEPAVTLTGQVVDVNDKGIADVEVRSMLQGPQWGSTIGRKAINTDNDGKYQIKALPPGRTYSIYARAEGYGESHSEQISTEAAVDNRVDAGKLTMTVANLSISGVVVDDNNKPVAGARINSYGDNQPYRNAQTDVDGKFTLEKVCAGKIRISANKTAATRLYGYIETEGGATDVRVVISERPSSMRYEPKRPPSLVGRPLPNLKDVGIDLTAAETDGKMILVCFFDMEQRPSRNCVMQLTGQAGQLEEKGLIVVTVQTSQVDEKTLNEWVRDNNIRLPVGIIKDDEKETRFNWGVESLPWLILTDSKHIVRAAGFRIDDLNEKIGEMTNVER
jgi:protocatechuate 3,4-dioxygenase beta subunit